jgi:hypothetical protein
MHFTNVDAAVLPQGLPLQAIKIICPNARCRSRESTLAVYYTKQSTLLQLISVNKRTTKTDHSIRDKHINSSYSNLIMNQSRRQMGRAR